MCASIWRVNKEESSTADTRMHYRALTLRHLKHRVAPVDKVALILCMLLHMAGYLPACNAELMLTRAITTSQLPVLSVALLSVEQGVQSGSSCGDVARHHLHAAAAPLPPAVAALPPGGQSAAAHPAAATAGAPELPDPAPLPELPPPTRHKILSGPCVRSPMRTS